MLIDDAFSKQPEHQIRVFARDPIQVFCIGIIANHGICGEINQNPADE